MIAAYYYDPFGRRLWKQVDAVRTYFVYSDDGLIGEYSETGTEIRSYGYKPGSTWTTDPLFLKENGQYYFYHNDHLGTPQKITSISGAVAWSAKYKAFGEADIDPASSVTNNLRFAGQYFDQETGFYYNYNRYFDPEVGRYVIVDPIGLYAGINLFTYVLNNPIINIDSKGLEVVDNGMVQSIVGTPKVISNYLAAEVHLGVGVGLTEVECCDENGDKRRFLYLKSCFGLAAGASGSAGVVSGINGEKCRPERYEGWTYELGLVEFIGVEVGVGLEDDTNYTDGFSGVNNVGVAPSIGFMGKATWCVYNNIFERKEHCGCKEW